MPTSGTYTPTITFNDIAEEALDQLQLGEDGETLSGSMLERARKTANFMLKSWAAQGIHLWTQTEGSLFLVKGQAEYDFATAKLANTWKETTTSAAEALGQATISCTSTADINVDDVVGILLDTKNFHWSTVQSKSSTTITLPTPIPSAAASGAMVVTYVASSFIPVNRITQVRRRESSTYEIPVNFESREDYFSLPDRSTEGTPIQAYFSRQEPPGTMYIWPTPSTASISMGFTYERPIQVIDNAGDELDVPDYWHEAIIYNLAKRLIPKFGCSMGRAQMITNMAIETLDLALGFDTETYPITMVMRNA